MPTGNLPELLTDSQAQPGGAFLKGASHCPLGSVPSQQALVWTSTQAPGQARPGAVGCEGPPRALSSKKLGRRRGTMGVAGHSSLGPGKETSQSPVACSTNSTDAHMLAILSVRGSELTGTSESSQRLDLGDSCAELTQQPPGAPPLPTPPPPGVPHSHCHSQCRRRALWQETQLFPLGRGTCNSSVGRAQGTALMSVASPEP